MKGHEARTVCTVAVWAAVFGVLTFSGVFQGQGDTGFWTMRMMMVAAIAGGGAWATQAMWRGAAAADAEDDTPAASS